MRGAGPSQSTNFVAEFAAKRAAQLERARQLRETRGKPSTPEAAPAQDRPPSGSPVTYARSHREDESSSYRPTSGSNHHQESSSSRDNERRGVPGEVLVCEDDFRRAVKHGIITPDQARQLWSVLSDPSSDTKLESFKRAQPPVAYDPSRYDDRNGEGFGSGSTHPYAGLDTNKPANSARGPKEWNFDTDVDSSYPEQRKQSAPAASGSRKVPGASYSVRQPTWNDDSTVDSEEPQGPVRGVANAKKTVAVKAQREAPAWNSDHGDNRILEEAPPPRKTIAKSLQPRAAVVASHSATKQAARPAVREPVAPPPPEVDEDEIEEFHRMKNEQARQFEEALEGANEGARLVPCNRCGRTFRETIIDRHELACAKANKKRKVFDMTKARIDGIDGAEEVLRQQKRSAKSAPAPALKPAGKIPKWKLQHQQFQAVLKNNKDPRALTGPPIPMPEELDDRVPCPHCGRKFATETAARHIPKCMTTINKPKSLARPIRR